jgi:hypothetical protein
MGDVAVGPWSEGSRPARLTAVIYMLGQVARYDGRVQQVDSAGDIDAFRLPSNSYLRQQASDLPVTLGHSDWRIGTVQHLERSRRGLFAVATIDDDLGDHLDQHGPFHLSAGVKCLDVGSTEKAFAAMYEVAVVKHPGNVNVKALRYSRSDAAPSGMSVFDYDTWQRGVDAITGARYRRSDRLTILDLDHLGADEALTDPASALAAALDKARASTPPPTLAPTVHRRDGVRVDGVPVTGVAAELALARVGLEFDDLGRIVEAIG